MVNVFGMTDLWILKEPWDIFGKFPKRLARKTTLARLRCQRLVLRNAGERWSQVWFICLLFLEISWGFECLSWKGFGWVSVHFWGQGNQVDCIWRMFDVWCPAAKKMFRMTSGRTRTVRPQKRVFVSCFLCFMQKWSNMCVRSNICFFVQALGRCLHLLHGWGFLPDERSYR